KWWEARKEIGALVNTTRNIALCLNGFLPPKHPEKTNIIELLTSYTFSLKDHLRDNEVYSHLSNLTDVDKTLVQNSQHKPNIIANIMISKIEKLWRDNELTD